MANASWLDPDGNMFLDSDERLMAPGSRRLPWPMLRREAEGDAVTLAGHRYIVEQAVLERLRREAAELVARNDAAEREDQRRLRSERLARNREIVVWTQMRRAYAQRGQSDGGEA